MVRNSQPQRDNFWIISENETASPQNSCVEYWTKYNEGSIIHLYYHEYAPNSLECQKLCQTHDGCLHWSYRLPGLNRGLTAAWGDDIMVQCTLFSSLSSISTPNINPQYQTSGYISGSKTSKNCTHVSYVEESRRYMS